MIFKFEEDSTNYFNYISKLLDWFDNNAPKVFYFLGNIIIYFLCVKLKWHIPARNESYYYQKGDLMSKCFVCKCDLFFSDNYTWELHKK